MANYRGQYINGLMQPPQRSDDYYDPYKPFDQEGPDAGYNPDDPFGSQESGKEVTMPDNPAPPGGGGQTTPDPAEPQTPPGPDTSAWDTNGYEKPGYVPESYGNAPSGWDPAKWANPNHQSPKYAVGRIIVANGDMKDPGNRQKAIADIQRAYPGATYNGKDRVTIPGVGTIDIFQDASSGMWGPAWQPMDGGGSGGSGSAYDGFQMPPGMPPLPRGASEQTTRSEYNSLLRQYLRRKQPGIQDKG